MRSEITLLKSQTFFRHTILMALLARRPAAAFVVALAAAAAGQTRWADLLFSGAKLAIAKASEQEV